MATEAERQQKVRDRRWYHTIELGPGLVTPGCVDLRPHVDRYGLPERLDGLRVLDVGTADGFWAFELERRGAEVVALDVDEDSECDWPPRRRPASFSADFRGAGFELAREILDSQAKRVHCNVYDASPERLGLFDLVFCASVLVHLRDQLLAAERLASVCAGRLILAEQYDRPSSLLPFPISRYQADGDQAVVFWLPARRSWGRMLWTAGFDDVHEHGTFRLKIRGRNVPQVVLHARQSATGAGRAAAR
ncbi:MAG TPA: class I SAM-dependent methyltransferase [Solirubrobacteraceae bacterium]|jgi:tRNA (mo5U34)-methyltransferase|nr:class I SAM-dependent methyltransferase [Solirubrobacteraceae bacterium]